ncbi:MAG: hypothetical protein OHK0023_00950 [Anaerolineae bacterium]
MNNVISLKVLPHLKRGSDTLSGKRGSIAIQLGVKDRTTNGTGRVQEMTFEELQRLDAGYNFPNLEEARTERPFRGQGVTIPSLEEVFFQVPEYGGGCHLLTEGFVEGARYHNVMVQPWTINSEEAMRRMIALNVNGIITDYPARLLELLGCAK